MENKRHIPLKKVILITGLSRAGKTTVARQIVERLRAEGKSVIFLDGDELREVHDLNRRNLPGYFEVYLKVSLEELKRRDPKGIYKNHQSGELKHVAGHDLKVDEPKKPDQEIVFSRQKSIKQTADDILGSLKGEK